MDKIWRQHLHLEPPQGWLNDPNGLSYYKGHYHFYFQYAPESVMGNGDKCWGHYVSKDLINWKFSGTVLVPDIPEDKDGVYSGSAIENTSTGKLELFYTGNVKETGDFDYILAGRGANVIKVTTEDGHNMSQKQVILRNSDYPKHCSCHVRDPKIWEENGIWKMILGARSRDDKGFVMIYESENLSDWKFAQEISCANFGYMWECPDLLKLNDQYFLSLSPQGLEHEEYCNQNVYSSGYFPLYQYDDPKEKNTSGTHSESFREEIIHKEDFEEWDYGFDFYAPQSFEAPDGRKILVGWMGIGDIPYSNPTSELGWQHCLTIPRELSNMGNGKIRQTPVREINSLRKNKIEFDCNKCDKIKTTLPFDMELELCENTDFEIKLNEDITIKYQGGSFSLKFNNNTGAGRTQRKLCLSKINKIRIVADTSSLEIYLNDGEKVMSSRYYPKDGARECELRFNNLDKAVGSVYEMNKMEVEIFGK